MIIVLLPGRDWRVLGVSTRIRNSRVAERAGGTIVSPERLEQHRDEPALLVPAETMINIALFPLPTIAEPTWLVGDRSAAVLSGPASCLAQYISNLDAARARTREQVSPAAVFDLSTAAARRHAAWSVLLRTGKATDGWVSRHCTRPISRLVSMVMLWMGFSANHASILTLLVGLGAAALAAQPGYLPLVGTGILLQAASMLDGVDGEMARATLTESRQGALLDTIVDIATYVAGFIGFTIGWVREGAGVSALTWAIAISIGLMLSFVRGGRFVSRYAPNASFVFIDRSVRRAARDSNSVVLRAAGAMFALLRRDVATTVIFFVMLTGTRAIIPALVAFGIVLANFTLTKYAREIVVAAVAERLSS
jgi:phosphatidylglycerophosphate synthase